MPIPLLASVLSSAADADMTICTFLQPTSTDVYVIMAKKNKVDAWVLKAAKLVVFVATKTDPENNLLILDAIWARKYSDEEAQNRTLQMQVRHLVEHLMNSDVSTSASTVSPVPPAAADPAEASAASSTAAPTKPHAKKPTTFQANADAPSDLCPLPKISPLKTTRKTDTQAQTDSNNKKKIDQLYATSLKRSTTWYAAESKKKEGGLSAPDIYKRFNSEFNGQVNFHPQTVTRYVKDGKVE